LFKLGDFGVSYQVTCTLAASSTKTLTGTPDYLSPTLNEAYTLYLMGRSAEVRVKHNVFKSDLFSLGLTYLRMATLKDIRRLNLPNS